MMGLLSLKEGSVRAFDPRWPPEAAPSVVAFPKGQVRLINNDHFTCHSGCILPTFGINFRNEQAPFGCKPQVKPLEQHRQKSSKRTRGRADEAPATTSRGKCTPPRTRQTASTTAATSSTTAMGALAANQLAAMAKAEKA